MTEMDPTSGAPASDPASKSEPPQMSEIGTVTSIFFEPGRTFDDLRRKPRFIAATIIIALFATAYAFGLYYKVGEAGMRRFVVEQLDKNPQAQSMGKEQKDNMVDLQMTIQNYVRFAVPLVILISVLVGGLFYFLGTKAFGGDGGFLHSVSVWVYSWLPPVVVGTLASFLVMALKSADEIDIAASQRGLVNANPSLLIDGKANPVIATLLSTLDLFMIWGWVLAAIGLRITNRLSSGSAWAVVIIL